MTGEVKISLVDLIAEARAVGGDEYITLLWQAGPPPEQAWRFVLSLPDGAEVSMKQAATATDIAAYLEWERSRTR